MEAHRRATEPNPDDAISELSQGNHAKGDWKDVLGTENSIERSNNLVWSKTTSREFLEAGKGRK